MDAINVDADVADIRRADDLGRDEEAREGFNAFSTGLKAPNAQTDPQITSKHPDTGGALRIDHWMANLPRNVSVGLIDAAVNTADTIREAGDSFYHSAAASLVGQPQLPGPTGADAAKPLQKATPGMLVAGNLDPLNRPILHNADGSISTTRSFSIQTDKGETLIPKIVDGRELSNQAAIEHYKQTGQHLGIFDTPDNADTYATTLHNAQYDAIRHSVGDTAYNTVKGAVIAFRDRLASGLENPEDLLTQGVAQLAIPGLGLAKLTGATASFGLLNTAHVAAADAAAAGVVLDPHSGRLADLAVLGKHAEGKLGAVFNTLAPDGSMMNHYLNWMHDRVGESDWGGRLKNMVDSLSGSAALAGVVNGAIGSIRLSRYMAESAGTAPVGLKAQLGMVAFHGSPNQNIESLVPGQRLSARGHGIYMSSGSDVAGEYVPKVGGSLYHVKVPDAVVGQMMHWDQPVVDQPGLAKVFNDLGIDQGHTAGEAYRLLSEKLSPTPMDEEINDWTHVTGAPNGDREASAALAAAGVPGIRYSASGKYSPGGSKAENYVLFDPKHAKIIKKE